MSLFASGMFFYYYFPFFKKYQDKLILPAIVDFMVEYYCGYCILMPFSLACIVIYIAFNFKVLNNFGKYGDFSYGIYIWHFPFIQLVLSCGLFSIANPWLSFILIEVFVIFIGYISWNVLEKRFLKRTKQRSET
jgi:peptidoglycan/LPS O-acetylase OafA/YrhL